MGRLVPARHRHGELPGDVGIQVDAPEEMLLELRANRTPGHEFSATSAPAGDGAHPGGGPRWPSPAERRLGAQSRADPAGRTGLSPRGETRFETRWGRVSPYRL